MAKLSTVSHRCAIHYATANGPYPCPFGAYRKIDGKWFCKAHRAPQWNEAVNRRISEESQRSAAFNA